MFHDRKDAGKKLAEKLLHHKNADAVVYAIPRGGVPVAYEVAKELNLPLEVLMAKKIGHPLQKEYAIGAVGLTNSILTSDIGISEKYIEEETKKIRAQLQENYKRFMEGKTPVDSKNKTVIIVDDGVATGSTLLSIIGMLKDTGPAKIVVAIPVAPPTAALKIRRVADEFICLMTPPEFQAVGQFYENFGQTEDEEVISLLKQITPQ